MEVSMKASTLPTVAVALVASMMIVGEASAELPAEIVAPGEAVVLTLHAQGAQIYECKAGTDGKFAWTFREPTATLLLDSETVGRHYAGPNWDHIDGSGVTGKVVAKAAGKTASDIPWLKLEATAHRGGGLLTAVTTIQRINTLGGVMSGACDEPGMFRSAPYSADYVFLGRSATQ
jgi:hypothetical protein